MSAAAVNTTVKGTATIDDVRELDARMVETDQSRYHVRLLWHPAKGTLQLVATNESGDEVAARAVPPASAASVLNHASLYLGLS